MELQNGRQPAVTVHYAQSLDGRIATLTGHSQWISGEDSRRFAHRLRADHRAVMVGVGTVLADNPRLTVRLVEGASPTRVVVDSTLRLPLDSHLLVDGVAPTVVATTARAPRERVEAVRQRGAELLMLEQDREGRVDLPGLLRWLAELGLPSVLIEGGRGIITSALRSRLVDRLVVCISPQVVGTGIEAVGDLGVCRLSEALTFQEIRVDRLGRDILFDGRFDRRSGGEGS